MTKVFTKQHDAVGPSESEKPQMVFIGALPFRANEAFIRDLVERFQIAGPIQLHADWNSPSFEPYALVSLQDADSAIRELDGLKIGAIHLRVHKKPFSEVTHG